MYKQKRNVTFFSVLLPERLPEFPRPNFGFAGLPTNTQMGTPAPIRKKYDRWKNVLKRLGEKTDKNIIIWNANESGGYWPLLSTETDNMLERIHNYSHPDNKIWYVNGDAHAE